MDNMKYQFPMGKVKAMERDYKRYLETQYQFPMGKVK